jgi:hypothetical protein
MGKIFTNRGGHHISIFTGAMVKVSAETIRYCPGASKTTSILQDNLDANGMIKIR